MNRKLQVFKYLLFDYLAAALAWSGFFLYRKVYIEHQIISLNGELFLDWKFYIGSIVIPACWLLYYAATGFYKNIYRKSRLTDLWQTIQSSTLGIVIIFFVLILDDQVKSYTNYYSLFFNLLGLHFALTYIPRLVLTSISTHKIHTRKIGFKTIIVGGNGHALETYTDMEGQEKAYGNIIVGFIKVKEKTGEKLAKHIPCLGDLSDLHQIIFENRIKEVIIAIEPEEQDKIGNIINQLAVYNISIKAIPSMYDFLTGKVKMSQIFGTPLIEITHKLMPYWQEQAKRIIDILASIVALILTLPLSIGLIIGIKITSAGSIFYSHERMGKYGKPFRIHKFRSMYIDAEKDGPQLSSKYDSRITPIGRFMRKMRFDEIPNFYNVLVGDMSLVGPRPERPFFIEQIMKVAPHYIHLQKVRPGITSWGQVKFGYASNVEQMVRRLKYDILYIENMSLYVDFKIIIYTLITIIKGKGM